MCTFTIGIASPQKSIAESIKHHGEYTSLNYESPVGSHNAIELRSGERGSELGDEQDEHVAQGERVEQGVRVAQGEQFEQGEHVEKGVHDEQDDTTSGRSSV